MKDVHKLNQHFQHFEAFLLDIHSYFSSSQYTIHKARNELKIINYKETHLVVKSFKVPHFLNKIVYTFFKKSKAQKSYEYSLKIKEFTPQAIGYIEFFSSKLLNESYFVAEEFKYDFTIREVLINQKFLRREEIFKQFADFTFKLHSNNILHNDYSPGNILIKKEKDNFTFKIVDINRMTFKNLSYKEKINNFSKLWADKRDIVTIAAHYAKISNQNTEITIELMQKYNTKNKRIKTRKKNIKQFISNFIKKGNHEN